ncbi:MAG: hypothetical protein JRF63_14535, partial [Deltaproteobacteria bacterium]|nr:hypothetical protein [Deltaproteobacteria bacterium]
PHRTSWKLVLPAGTREHKLPVYQGNSETAAENAYLGTIVLDDIDASSRELVGQLRFEVDNECMLTIAVEFPTLGVDHTIELAALTPPLEAMEDEDPHVDQIRVVEQRPAPAASVAGGTSAAPARKSWLARLLSALRLRRG